MSPALLLNDALQAARACSQDLRRLTTSLPMCRCAHDLDGADHRDVSGSVLALVDTVLALDAALENRCVVSALQKANHDLPILVGARQERSFTECLCDAALGVVMGVVIAVDPERLQDDILSPTITREFLDERLANVEAIQYVCDSVDIALAGIDLATLQDEIEAEFRRAADAEETAETREDVPTDPAPNRVASVP